MLTNIELCALQEVLLIHSLCRWILSICCISGQCGTPERYKDELNSSLLWGTNQGRGMAGRRVISTWEGKNKVLEVQRIEDSRENQDQRMPYVHRVSFIHSRNSLWRKDGYKSLLPPPCLPDTVLQDFTYIIWCKIINRQCRRKIINLIMQQIWI